MQPSPRPSGPFQNPGERPDQELWGSYEPMGDVCSCVCVCVHLCVFVCLPMYVFICVSVCFYVCMCVERMSVCDCEWISVCLCPCACVGASFGVALRGGGLPVHGYLPQVGLGHRYPLESSLVVGMVHPTKHQQAALLRPAEERRRGLLEESNTRHCLRTALLHPSEALLRSPFYTCGNRCLESLST